MSIEQQLLTTAAVAKALASSMKKDSKIVVVGAGVFGLTTALELANEGYANIVVLDRHIPPVPDGSSNDLSRVIRFDYADEDYMKIAYDAYQIWRSSPRFDGIFYPTTYILVATDENNGAAWIKKTSQALSKDDQPLTHLDSAQACKEAFPILTGDLAAPGFKAYHHQQAGWADANKAILQLRNDCLNAGVSFVSGRRGTITGFQIGADRKIEAVQTLSGVDVQGDHFILAAGAWASSLVPMYNSTLSTAQVLGYMKLTPDEMQKYRNMPIYSNMSSGWFNFPPHEDTSLLKMAVHGWGYTRPASAEERAVLKQVDISTPPLLPSSSRKNYVPKDAEQRLRAGLREILPELADREYERLAMCWYTDTPTGDFIMDYHPDYSNLFVAGGGSGHAFKFLPVLGRYTSLALKKALPSHLASKWRFRTEYDSVEDVFLGDGSRGGPARRELRPQERARL